MTSKETTKDLSLTIPGNRVGLLLFHGLGGTPMELRYVAYGVARAGHTVHCPLLAGHGGSVDDVANTSWQDWYASAEAALHRIRQDCDVVFVGGLSVGAVLALLLAARNPKLVQGTVSYAPIFWLNGWVMPWYARLFNLVHHKWFANKLRFEDAEPHGIKDPRVRDLIANALKSADNSVSGIPYTPGGAVLEHRWMVKAFMREAAKVTQPSLVLHPREDDHADIDNSEFLQRHLGGRVELVVLDDSYHIITIDRQRQVVVDRTVSFMSQVAAEIEAAKPSGRDRTKAARADHHLEARAGRA
jgi:carboxylesterase